MKVLNKIVCVSFTLLICLGVNSCGNESKIDPAFSEKKLQNNFLSEPVGFEIPTIEINRPFNLFSVIPIPIVSDFADTLTNMFLDIFLFAAFSNGVDISTDEDVTYLELGEIDKETIHTLQITRFELTFENRDKKFWEHLQPWSGLKEDLTFFKNITVFFATQEMLDRNPDTNGVLFAYHDAENPSWCDKKKKCLRMKIPDINLLDYIEKPTKIYIIPKIEVGKTPANFELKGRVEVAFGTDFGF